MAGKEISGILRDMMAAVEMGDILSQLKSLDVFPNPPYISLVTANTCTSERWRDVYVYVCVGGGVCKGGGGWGLEAPVHQDTKLSTYLSLHATMPGIPSPVRTCARGK